MENRAEKAVTKPMDTSQGVAMHAIFNPSELYFSSSSDKGTIADDATIVPTHTIRRKVGWDFLMMGWPLLTMVNKPNPIAITRKCEGRC